MECDEDCGRQITAELMDLTGIRRVSKERILGLGPSSWLPEMPGYLRDGLKGQHSLIARGSLWIL
jgi:hypothetical protein